MSLFMILRVAIKALGRNKMRTGLTMLGMIIGVAAVITMVALGSGAQQSIEDQIKSAGTNMITVSAGNWSSGGVRRGWGSATTLSVDDARAIREQVPGVQYVAAGTNTRTQVVFGNQNWSTRVQGTDVELPLIRFWPTEFGTFFSETDVAAAAKVAVLGTIVRDTLFGEGADPVGQTIRLGKHPFKVIGVMAVKGPGSFGEDQDDTIFMPYTTVQKKLRGIRYIQSITVSAISAPETIAVSEEIAALLRVQHGLIPGDEDDFRVRTLEEMASVRSETTRTMTSLLASIAGVSLLVGGIGIMNIMLVSVTERTREIGLRMAVGAKGKDVLFQFLVEAIVLSLFGGSIGIGLGVGLSRGITQFLEWPTTVSPDAVVVAFGFAAITGIFFGFYPARKAASLDPIESLRFE
ncbi:MAG: ABC transporter permease [Vicinamibacterales bacterium]|jgi:putative ABC transport system permease protein|nr:multidrug ABC transporter substrate-binding protein [Acidobacteriota bacterium]MDP6373912.1 ABC transporter permease [Vicinamibacterales bacterium]MDP6610599.1 ABC transporter permease [Vicinamibacterales bacterium]|tara:strand:- start:25663 stop:26883 length:1221 start_codon:yes stop_codon:yes gene_type:complete